MTEATAIIENNINWNTKLKVGKIQVIVPIIPAEIASHKKEAPGIMSSTIKNIIPRVHQCHTVT